MMWLELLARLRWYFGSRTGTMPFISYRHYALFIQALRLILTGTMPYFLTQFVCPHRHFAFYDCSEGFVLFVFSNEF